MDHTSYLELSQSAIAANFEYIRKVAGEHCRISHVVKGNAYGHGIESFVPLAQKLGADHFSTFDALEALAVHKATNEQAEIMIMGMIDNDQLEWAVEHNIQFFVFEIDRLHAAVKVARKLQKKAQIHLELETGMNRTGFEKENQEELISFLKKHSDYLSVKGLCTHYAGAESYSNFIRINKQYQRFEGLVKEFRKESVNPEMLHTACSAATIRLPHTRMDMVRIGILQYGFWPSRETYIQTMHPQHSGRDDDPLKRVLSWKSRVMNIKKVKQGEYIGYGTSFLASQDMKVATIPVGYSHGFSRSLSNRGRALIRGRRVSVIGIVNMNEMMLDVSQVDGVEKGDEVVLIGRQGDLTISVSSFSDYSNQLNYELLTRLPHNIPRHIVN